MNKTLVSFIFVLFAVVFLIILYFEMNRHYGHQHEHKSQPFRDLALNKKPIVHFVIPLCPGEEKMYEIFIKNLHKIKHQKWDLRLFVIHQMDAHTCFWSALVNIGLKKSLNQNEANCVIIQSVYQLPLTNFDYGKCKEPIILCKRKKDACFYRIDYNASIEYDSITATSNIWRDIIHYDHQSKFRYERIHNNYDVMFKSKLKDIETYSRPCDCPSIPPNKMLRRGSHISNRSTTEQLDMLNKSIYFVESTKVDSWGSKWINVQQWTIDQLKRRNVVLPNHKLIFFPNIKAGMYFWKCLLYYVEFNKIYPKENQAGLFPHLMQYSDDEALDMLFGEAWTKFTVVREPRERILSAYLHKAVYMKEVQNSFCKTNVSSFSFFVDLIKTCKNDHWGPQIYLPTDLYNNMLIGRMGRKYNITLFIDNLLKRIGAFGRVKGWMESDAIISWAKHPTNAKDKITQYYNRELERKIIAMYQPEYELFGFDDGFFA